MKSPGELHREIISHYGDNPLKEWRRTRTGESRLEFLTTMHFLRKQLPRRGKILDAGCGPGRYAVELARMGYRVTGLDPVVANLAFARRMAGRDGLAGNIDALLEGRIEDMRMFESSSFDAVTCLGGPLSHVMDARLRSRAARELVRVARPGAPLFVSVMSRFTVVDGLLNLFPSELESEYVEGWTRTGDYGGTVFGKKVFTAFHGFTAAELGRLFAAAGLRKMRVVGLEGFGARSDKAVERLFRDRRRWDIWFGMHLETAMEQSIVGGSAHIMVIGRKRA